MISRTDPVIPEEGNLEDGIADSGEHHLVDYHRHEHHELHGIRTVLMADG